MILRPLTQQQARDAWGWIRNGLLHVAEKADAHWIPEDVYAFVMAGSAHVYACESKGDDVGFAVVQKQADPDGPALFVWALWAEPGALERGRDEVMQRFDELARSIGAKRIRMNSPRRGWTMFFESVAYVYERDVS